jgi:predicted dehydrogenase
LNAGKHVLVEKPATVNAPEWLALIALAKSKRLFIMEAMWTRFLPITLSIKKVIESGELGDLRVL